jgi:hypothetical protein
MQSKRRLSVCALAAVGGLAFGAGDQYLGSIHVSAHFAAASTVSGMSAPWLLLPFVAGVTCHAARRSALAGLVSSVFAVAGYTAMIISPVEGAHPVGALLATPRSQLVWFLAAMVSGPVYGVLGYRWRAFRSRLAAVLATGPLLLEPIAGFLKFGRWSSGDLAGYELELAAALFLGCYVVVASARYRPRASGATTTSA